MLRGVISVKPGYAGGELQNPTYEEVCGGTTGHVEVVRIDYDAAIIPFETLLTIFFASHDPTTLNRQGNDVGTQYRSVIFYMNEDQRTAAEKCIAEANTSADEGASIITTVEPAPEFYEAENYHHDYFARNSGKPYCAAVIQPKLKKIRGRFAELLNAE